MSRKFIFSILDIAVLVLLDEFDLSPLGLIAMISSRLLS